MLAPLAGQWWSVWCLGHPLCMSETPDYHRMCTQRISIQEHFGKFFTLHCHLLMATLIYWVMVDATNFALEWRYAVLWKCKVWKVLFFHSGIRIENETYLYWSCKGNCVNSYVMYIDHFIHLVLCLSLTTAVAALGTVERSRWLDNWVKRLNGKKTDLLLYSTAGTEPQHTHTCNNLTRTHAQTHNRTKVCLCINQKLDLPKDHCVDNHSKKVTKDDLNINITRWGPDPTG